MSTILGTVEDGDGRGDRFWTSETFATHDGTTGPEECPGLVGARRSGPARTHKGGGEDPRVVVAVLMKLREGVPLGRRGGCPSTGQGWWAGAGVVDEYTDRYIAHTLVLCRPGPVWTCVPCVVYTARTVIPAPVC